MKLENQVVSLELAKKLKELGVKQESLFYWVLLENEFGKDWIIIQGDDSIEAVYKNNKYSAFTVAELGEILPELCLSGNTGEGFNCWKFRNIHDLAFYNPAQSKTEADARAKMIIYLIENKLIKL